jgi:hypothetical protein
MTNTLRVVKDVPVEIRQQKKRTLPKGVYKSGSRFDTVVWEVGGKLKRTGTYGSADEAEYHRNIAARGHHWLNMPEDRSDYFGFTYELEHKATGRLYIGCKQFHFWQGPVGGYKCTEPTSEFWDGSLWKGSDWHTYMSSARDVSASCLEEPWAWEYKVTGLHKNKLDLNLNEVIQQVNAQVLTAVDINGDYKYLNKNIMGKEYRPAVPIEKLKLQEKKTIRDIRDYYLKPEVCSSCGEMIPFGTTRCPNAPLFGKGGCSGRTTTV